MRPPCPIICLVGFVVAGCSPSPAPQPKATPAPSSTSGASAGKADAAGKGVSEAAGKAPEAPPAKPDPPEVVKQLETLGCILTKNDAGNVIKVDCKAATGLGDAQAAAFKELPSLVDLSLENAA